tara:strand:+ start:1502 stop:2128 length:627 start_codon:yes stop_codon:yes gene_type:complete
MQSKRVSLNRLINPFSKVSCHYFIDRSGNVLRLAEDNEIAWHAGKSKWKKFKNLNEESIGIELVNKGHKFGYQKFSKSQINNLLKLCLILKKKYKIKNSFVLGHSDIAPLRKLDPGEKFPWRTLKKKGLGVWYPKIKKNLNFSDKKNLRNSFFKNLFKIGYRYFSKTSSSKKDKYVIRAFQRRFLQNKVDGKIDQKTLQISHYLAKIR